MYVSRRDWAESGLVVVVAQKAEMPRPDCESDDESTKVFRPFYGSSNVLGDSKMALGTGLGLKSSETHV